MIYNVFNLIYVYTMGVNSYPMERVKVSPMERVKNSPTPLYFCIDFNKISSIL